MTLHIYRPRRFHWTWIHPWLVNSGIRNFPGVHVMSMGTTMWQDRQMTWRCTSTGQDSSNELDLELICPLFAEFQRPHYELDLKWICPVCVVPVSARFQECLSCVGTLKSIGLDNPNELDLELICQEFCCPQDSRSPFNIYRTDLARMD